MTAPTRVPARIRCAVHPSRPAIDACPVCGRPRCGVDAASVPTGCLGCGGSAADAVPRRPPPGDAERLVRGALAAYAVALLGGLVASEYVGATVFAYLGPFVVGVVCGGAGTRAAGTEGRGSTASRVRAIAALCALLGVGLSFVVEGSLAPTALRAQVLLPYAAAVAGALLWTMPPRQRQGLSTEA